MALGFFVDADIEKIDRMITGKGEKAIGKAAKNTLNDLARKTKTESAKRMRQIFNFRGLKRHHGKTVAQSIVARRTRSTNISNMQTSTVYDGKPINLISFVQGDTSPENQKGKKITSRRKVTYSVVRGVKRGGKGLFIQKVNGKNKVFRRAKDSKSKWVGQKGKRKRTALPIKSQSYKSIAVIAERDVRVAPFIRFKINEMGPKLWEHHVQQQLDKI